MTTQEERRLLQPAPPIARPAPPLPSPAPPTACRPRLLPARPRPPPGPAPSLLRLRPPPTGPAYCPFPVCTPLLFPPRQPHGRPAPWDLASHCAGSKAFPRWRLHLGVSLQLLFPQGTRGSLRAWEQGRGSGPKRHPGLPAPGPGASIRALPTPTPCFPVRRRHPGEEWGGSCHSQSS